MKTDLVVVSKDGNHQATTSLIVAEKYEIEHKHIMAKIRNIEESQPEFAKANFGLCSYLVNNRPQPFYEMTLRGLTFLIMELSGPRAEEAQLAFIDAFDRMEQLLIDQTNTQPVRSPQTYAEALRELADKTESEAKLIDLDEIKNKKKEGEKF